MENSLLQFSLLSNLKTGNPIADVLISGAILSLITWLVTNYMTSWDSLKKFFAGAFRRRIKSEIFLSGEELINNGSMSRDYSPGFCAILHYITKHEPQEVFSFEEIRTARKTFQDDYNMSYDRFGKPEKKDDKIMLKPSDKLTRPFLLAPKIFCEVTVIETKSDDRRNPMKVKTTLARVFSHEVAIPVLRKFIEGAIEDYETHMKEDVEKNQYYFITKMVKNAGGMGMGMGSGDDEELGYDQYRFRTNRSFNNIFYSQKPEVQRRLDFFLNNKDWYNDRGVPYTLGFLFYGPPGTGKTSTIKAIANYTKRHVVEVSLGRIHTYRDLQRVFHENMFCEKFIPHHKIIFVLEDIDCLDDIVRTRDGKANKEFTLPDEAKKNVSKLMALQEEKEEMEDKDPAEASKLEAEVDKLGEKAKKEFEKFKEFQKMRNSDPLTLSHLLNILDGLLETPGRILIITSNHPEKLDEALIRPGRVDMKVEFGPSTVEDTINCLEMFYKIPFPAFERRGLSDRKYTAAQIYNICFQSKSMDDAISRLKTERVVNELAKSAPNIPFWKTSDFSD